MARDLGTYTHGHHRSVVSQHRKRTAAEAAGFLLPELRSGMRLLDVGCGPGSITLGLAARVAPGPVLAIDLAGDVLVEARRDAARQAVTNVRFECADLLALEQPEGFDVAYAHQVLQHVPEPALALAAMHRLLAPGGAVAVRDSDYGTCTWSPEEPALTDWLALYSAVARRNGGEPDAGRHLSGWVRAAGFSDLRVSGTTWTFPGYDTPASWANSWAERTLHSNLGAKAVEYGLATTADLEAIAAALRRWGARDDAFFSIGHIEVLARRP